MNQFPLHLQRLAMASCLLFMVSTSITIAEQTTSKQDAKRLKQHATAWRLQAETTANELGLPETERDGLIETYVSTRKARRKLIKELSKGENENGSHRKQVDEINTKQQEHFKNAVLDLLDAEQTDTVLMSLGSFNPRWDRYVSQIQEYELNDHKKQDALRLTYKYIVDYGKARSDAKAEGDRLSSVIARDLKSTLDSGLAEFLSKEQLSNWNEVTAFRSGGSARSASRGRKSK